MSNQVVLTFAGEDRDLERAFARVGKSSEEMSRKVKKSSDEFGSAGQNVSKFRQGVEAAGKMAVPAAATAAGLLGAAVAPALAAALAGGVVLALGGGVLAAGIALAAKDSRVGAAFQSLKNRFMDIDTTQLEQNYKDAQARMTSAAGKQSKARATVELSQAKKALDDAQAYNKKNFSLKDAAKPFVKPLVDSLKIFTNAASTVIPQVGQLFSNMSVVVAPLAKGFVGLITNALPGLSKGVNSSIPAFQAIAGFLPKIGTWIGVFVAKMAELFEWGIKNKDSIGKWISVLAPIIGIFLGIIGAIKVWIGVQEFLNIVMSLNPIGLIIIAVAALIAVIVVIATKTHWFQDVWHAAWGGIKKAAEAVGSWFKDTLWGKWIKGAWNGIKDAGVTVWNWMKKLPGNLGSAFSGIAKIISAPFRSAFNFVADAWNNTIGRLSWSVPGWVPGIGGDSISVPNLPHFHSGGVVGGTPGSEQLAVLQAGEQVRPVTSTGGGDVLLIKSGGSELDDLLVEVLSRSVRRRGGNVQLVLGGRNA